MFVALASVVTGHAARGQSPAPLVVRLYNTAHLRPSDLLMARDEAVGILRDTGLNVTFRKCGAAASAGGAIDACDETLESSEVVVRVINAPAFNATLDPEGYGITYVVNELNRGWLATVFADRITVAASRVDVEPGVLVGRVMAHEIGHLLLGRNYHGHVGVMQAEWTDAMLTRPGDEWHFTMLEAARMRQIRSLLR
jgi:hypothetical protein